MRRLTKKRLTWLLALASGPFSAWLGDRHYDRWRGHPWKADRADRADRSRGA